MYTIWNPVLREEFTEIPMGLIVVDQKYHCRSGYESNTVALRSLLSEEGVVLDPLVVVISELDIEDWDNDRSRYPILIDGFDRYYAYSGLYGSEHPIPVKAIVVEEGVDLERAALFLSTAANIQNRLQKPRSRADKRKAITTLLMDDEWRTYSDRLIASHLGLGHSFVGQVRQELETKSLIVPVATFTSQNGKTFSRAITADDIEACEARRQEVHELLASIDPAKHEQIIDMAWEVQQQQGGGIVEPHAYREAIAHLMSGDVIDRMETHSYAKARNGQHLIRAIQGVRQYLEPASRLEAIELLAQDMSRDEINRATKVLQSQLAQVA